MTIYEAYYRYTQSWLTLYDCYKRPSLAKQRIWDRIVKESVEDDGDVVSIISYNSHIFTCGYTFESDGGTKYFVYITPSRTRVVKVSDIVNIMHRALSNVIQDEEYDSDKY